MTRQAVLRFAPSPNGELHLGHAYSALFTWRRAQELDGRFLLRIEDIDLVRSRQAFIDGILEDLAWLGLVWEEPVRRQSEHFAEYREALGRLDALGVIYPCFASRGDIRSAVAANPKHPRDPDGAPLYPGLAKIMPADQRAHLLAQGTPHVLRLDVAAALELAKVKAGSGMSFEEHGSGLAGETGLVTIDPTMWGDVILARKDIKTSYHLSVAVDDAVQGITHITRGQDLFYATHIHRLLQVLLDLPEPVYHHHRLIGDAGGRKLAKSAGDKSLKALREEGWSRQSLLDYLKAPEFV